MFSQNDYKNIILKSPIACKWVQVDVDENERAYYIKILGMNEKFKKINKNTIKENCTYKIDDESYSDIEETIQNLSKDSRLEIIEVGDVFYESSINHIRENIYAIWYIKELEIDKNIRDLLKERYASRKSDFKVFSKKIAELLVESDRSGKISEGEMLDFISNTIPDSVFLKDVSGVFRYCNNVFAENRGLTKEDVVGKTDKGINTPQHKILKYKKEDEEIIRFKQKSININTIKSNDGRVKYFETIKVPLLNEYKDVIGVLGISRDISHRKEAEEEFERLRMEFFANLSHEFKTPLNLIFSCIQLIELIIDKEGDSEKYKTYTNIIKQNGYRLLKMVNNLIDSTRLSAGCLELSPQNYNIVEFIEKICNSVEYYAREHSIELIFETNIEEKTMAFDLEKMERIILNLLSNAIKYNKEQGKIKVKLEFEDEMLNISIKDTGVGIPSDRLEEVFKLFKQINNRITKLSEGSGIGLSIVKSLVDLHNGSIDVYSEEGEGSEFLVKIPRVLCENENQPKSAMKYNRYIETIDIEFSDIYAAMK